MNVLSTVANSLSLSLNKRIDVRSNIVIIGMTSRFLLLLPIVFSAENKGIQSRSRWNKKSKVKIQDGDLSSFEQQQLSPISI